MIAYHLDAFSLTWLQYSCRRFRESIPSPTHPALLEAEVTEFGTQNDLYACRDCLRLRTRDKFADLMVKRTKAKRMENCRDRWCVDCGINPRPGTNRYNAGNIITILDKPYAICLMCRKFRAAALENEKLPAVRNDVLLSLGEPVRVVSNREATPKKGKPLSICQVCQQYERRIEEREEADRERQERARLRAEQAERRARRREAWGSASDSDDVRPPSPTWSEMQMDMIQAEADMYMNSPGSD